MNKQRAEELAREIAEYVNEQWNDSEKYIAKNLTEAYEAGRADGLEEAANFVERNGVRLEDSNEDRVRAKTVSVTYAQEIRKLRKEEEQSSDCEQQKKG